MLKRLPENLSSLDNLRILHIKACRQLSSFGSKGGPLRALNHLTVSSNNAAILPESFDSLPSLRQLRVDICPLRKLPSRIGALSNLEALDLSSYGCSGACRTTFTF